MPRDPFSATAEDFNRFDTAVVWALRDVRTALSRIAAFSTDSFLLYGTSFGAHLAMMCGLFDDPVRTDRNRIKGVMALYGSVRDAMPTWLMMHGAGHGTGGLTASALKGIAEETLMDPRVPTGRYRLLPDGSIITGPGGGGGPPEGP